MVGARQMTGRGPGRGARKTLRMKLWLGGAVAALLGVTPAVAQATEPASTYNTDGQEHNDVCVNSGPSLVARGPSLDLRYLSGLATGFQLLRITPDFDPGGKCVRGQIRLDLHEVLAAPSTSKPRGVLKDGLVFHRGGSDYVDAENVRYGQLAVSELRGTSPADLARRTRPSGGNRGAPATCPTPDTPYKVSVQPIPSKMKYKSPKAAKGSNAGSSYLHYGDPAAQQGQQNPQKYLAPSWDPTQQIHYSTLTWSWINVAGGGENRILLAPGQDIRPCDVEPIDHPSWAPGSDPTSDDQVNGSVEARYVQTQVGDGAPVYGWMVWTHQYYYDDSDNYIGPELAPVVDHFTTG
jgi:hypothetical protein